LADLGAEVTKVESPQGDDTPTWALPLSTVKTINRPLIFIVLTGEKTALPSIFGDAAGLKKLKSIIADSDILVENLKVGGLEKFGLVYESLKAENPKLVYCSVTGFGQDGPYASRAGYDFLIQGMSGIMSLTGEPDGPPQKIGVAFADVFSGLYGVIGIQGALTERNTSGLGQHIDISLLDCMTGVLANQAMNYLASGNTPKRLGNAHPNIAPYQTFATSDGDIIVACWNDRQFSALCGVLGLDHLGTYPKFTTNPERVSNRAALTSLLGTEIQGWTKHNILQAMETAVVPAAPINTVTEALNDPKIVHRGLPINPEGVPGCERHCHFQDQNCH
jgi:crotonobetainyl-CoA:carnitine CoA-transferase CaiB-like acyl-CoA transferase